MARATPSVKDAEDAMRLATNAWWLWADSCFVIWSRSMMIMAGAPGADKEAERMVAEKVRAAQELGWQAMTGALGTGMIAAQKSVDFYGRRVSANRRRLSKRK